MLSLNDRTWKAFKLIDLFEYNRGNQNKMNSLTDGDYPLVSAKNINNGLKAFVKENDKSIYGGNSMSLNNDGDGGVGIAYYQPHDYYLDSHCTALYPKNTKSRLVILFLCASTTKQRSLFSHGHSISEKRLKKIMIMLPTADDGSPDYAFMEQYIREREDKLKQKYIDFIGDNYQSEGGLPSLEEKTWGEFFISDICYITSGRDIYDSERIDGNIPYVTSTASNNGIKYYVSNTNETLEENAISVNRNGSVGYSFYHKYKALYSNDCRKLKLKQCRNEFVALFITNQITQQKDKYNYGYKMGTGRLKKQMIMLPTTDDGSPDYEYMEQYVKAVMFRKCKSYLEYAQN